MLHTHFAGSALRVRHFRHEKELPLIQGDDNYDFNFQEVRLLKKEVEVKPVSIFITVYSKNRNKLQMLKCLINYNIVMQEDTQRPVSQ